MSVESEPGKSIDKDASPETIGERYELPVTIKINPVQILLDPVEWAGWTLHDNRELIKTALQQWQETEEGRRIIALAKEYQGCRDKIGDMQDMDRSGNVSKSSSFSKEDAMTARKRMDEIRNQFGIDIAKESSVAPKIIGAEKYIDDLYNWIIGQE